MSQTIEQEIASTTIDNQRRALEACRNVLEDLGFPESQGILFQVNNALRLSK